MYCLLLEYSQIDMFSPTSCFNP
ncbi:hypothetical protein M3J09_010006 [Ascochyta lentis]